MAQAEGRGDRGLDDRREAQVASESTAVGGGVTDTSCSQCGLPALVEYQGHGLCVDHHFKMQQAAYMQQLYLAAHINWLEHDIAVATGFIVPPNYIDLAPLPAIGNTVTFNHINITDSNVGVLNTGTFQRFGRLDVSIGMFADKGQRDLASALKRFSEEVLKQEQLAAETREEIAQHLEFLVAQAHADEKDRQKPLAKTVLRGMLDLLGGATSLTALWEKLGSALGAAIGIQ